ncbi:hypothetical protein [Elioraea rosea]|uniref:hypothetical protein n=1 Tax=Elioraea rosea TaxID=2492390 RepID=UPI001185DD50|nr:hypothetical protein [Elioraea rosea]
MQSYILLSQGSAAFGTRDTWAAPGSTAGTGAGIVEGAAAAVARSAFDLGDTPLDQAGADTLLASLDWALDGSFSGSFLAAALEDGRAFETAAGPRNPELGIFAEDGEDFLEISVDPGSWNGIKNLEMLMTSELLGSLNSVVIDNLVDVRVKIGDTPADEIVREGPIARTNLVIANAKRGEVDATESPESLQLGLFLASNSPEWQTSFDIRGSVFNDAIVLLRGDNEEETIDGQTLGLTGLGQTVFVATGDGHDFVSAARLVEAALDVCLGRDGGSWSIGEDGAIDVVLPDTLQLSDGAVTIRYAFGDGVDLLTGFESGRDRIILENVDPGAFEVSQIGEDTLIAFADGGALIARGVVLGEADILFA